MTRLCSACLLGIDCRYDGGNKKNDKIIGLSKHEELIPFCPEQLGGESTPREAREIREGRVITVSDIDVTDKARLGAQKSLELARRHNVNSAILKSKSPSCGSGQVYDGTFSGKLVEGDGITARLFKDEGMKVVTENDF